MNCFYGIFYSGILITSDEQEQTLDEAFSMFKNLLPENSFYGSQGPQLIMTDNCDELRNCLRRAWPNAVLYLCTFHILQQVWRWLFEKEHRVSKDDRMVIMKHFRSIVYAQTKEELDEKFEEFMDLDMIEHNHCCKSYFKDLAKIESAWALCYRKDVLTRGSHTNNYVEAQFGVVKDGILRRQRQFNVNMLLDKLMSEFEQHFKVKLLSVADGSFDGTYSSRYGGGKYQIPGEENHFK